MSEVQLLKMLNTILGISIIILVLLIFAISTALIRYIKYKQMELHSSQKENQQKIFKNIDMTKIPFNFMSKKF
jgi:hypothetical protein